MSFSGDIVLSESRSVDNVAMQTHLLLIMCFSADCEMADTTARGHVYAACLLVCADVMRSARVSLVVAFRQV